MSLTINVEKINWQEAQNYTGFSGFTTLNVHVPRERTGFASSIEGKLHVSKSGLVYSHSSRSLLWIKFLGLASMLTIFEMVSKCKSFATEVFGGHISRDIRDKQNHISTLATIARKAVVCSGGHHLIKRVEDFALAEINKIKGDKTLIQELDRRRAERLSEGYLARCMQPLFHVDQTNPTYPQTAERCNKYATNAILYQNGCLTQTMKDMTTETQQEIECCDIMCYRQQKVCGLLYKIDCCAISCWAVDFGCCFCCLWPSGRTVCVL